MRIAIYLRHLDAADRPALDSLVDSFRTRGISVTTLSDGDNAADSDFLLSVGGDGTLLSCVQFVRSESPESFPPILGINFGHLGFLTTVGRQGLDALADDLAGGRYTLEERSLLAVTGSGEPLAGTSYSLNEVFLHRREEASLLRTEVYVDGQYVATYAGDGVIVATPTGSTAYSLSCGGPILTPDSRCLLVTPISAHTLTLRPVVVPDTAKIRLHVCDDCHLGIDSRRTVLGGGTDLALARAPFTIRLVRMGHQNFFSAIRDKLMWGTEIRP